MGCLGEHWCRPPPARRAAAWPHRLLRQSLPKKRVGDVDVEMLAWAMQELPYHWVNEASVFVLKRGFRDAARRLARLAVPLPRTLSLPAGPARRRTLSYAGLHMGLGLSRAWQSTPPHPAEAAGVCAVCVRLNSTDVDSIPFSAQSRSPDIVVCHSLQPL